MIHHYLPQFYLRKWAYRGNKILHFMKQKNAFFENNINKTGCKNNLYKLAGINSTLSQIIEERAMSIEIDQKASGILEKLLIEEVELDSSEQLSWCRFVVSLILRNPYYVNYLKHEGKRILQEMRQSSDDPHWFENCLRLFPGIEDNLGLIVLLGLIFDEEEIVQSIVQAIYPGIFSVPYKNYFKIIYENNWLIHNFDKENTKLLTGNLFYTLSIIPAENIIILPLSPRTIFISANKTLIENYLSKDYEELINEINIKILHNPFSDNIYYNDIQQRKWIENNF